VKKSFILFGGWDIKLKKSDIYKHELLLLSMFIYPVLLTGLIFLMSLIIWKAFLFFIVSDNSTLTMYIYKFRLLLNVDLIKNIFAISIFLFSFHMVSKNKIIYFLEISNQVKDMSNGNFKARIPVNPKLSLGGFAKNINTIMSKFNDAILEERKSEQTKRDLITNISHDLRTPLTSIIGYLELVDSDKYKDELTLRHYTNIAYLKSKRLKFLIDDLFELTTLNNYGLKLSKENINLIELLNQITLENRLNFRKANMECRLYFPDEKIFIFGDVNKLVRAFENLLTNCIKHSKSSPFIDIYVHKNVDKVILKFINYGEPIPAIDIPFIFERFYRVEKSRSEESGGSGLGLAIAKNIIELHDGNITVESSIQETSFNITFPISST